LLGALFLVAAYNKAKGYGGATGYFGRLGVPAPAVMVWVVVAFEAICAVALIVGYQTRLAALGIAAFVIVAAVIAHTKFADGNQLNHFLKNFAVAGGALALFVSGPGSYSMDGRR
jgi:putative oxidoreductase